MDTRHPDHTRDRYTHGRLHSWHNRRRPGHTVEPIDRVSNATGPGWTHRSGSISRPWIGTTWSRRITVPPKMATDRRTTSTWEAIFSEAGAVAIGETGATVGVTTGDGCVAGSRVGGRGMMDGWSVTGVASIGDNEGTSAIAGLGSTVG
jgi:hypothetical protein